MNNEQNIGVIDETAYLAYEGQGFTPLTEEQKQNIKNNDEDTKNE